MEHTSPRKPRVAAQAAIPIILKYDLLRNEELREAVLSTLSAGKNAHAAEGIKHSRWDILQSLFRDYLTGRATVISDVRTGTNLAKDTVRRCLGELQTLGIVGIRSDKNDRRRRVVFLTDSYREIVDRFVSECSVEFKDLIELHDRRQRDMAEAHTRAILENALDAIITIDREGRIVEFNRSAERIFGYRASQVIGQQMADLIVPPTLRKQHNEAFRRHMRKGKGTISGKRIITTAMAADGHELDVEVTLMSIKEDEDEHFTAFIRDITEQKRAEEALKESEEQFRSVFESSPAGIALHTADGFYLRVNKVFCDIFGYSEEEFLGLNWRDISHPDDVEMTERLDKRILAGEIESFLVEKRYVHKDGSCVWAEVASSCLRDNKGNPRFFIGQFIDITERMRTEEALRESEEEYRTLFQTMAQGVVYQDASGRIISANPAAERILGLTLDQMQGRTSIDPRWKSIHEDGSEFPGRTHPAMVALETGEEVRDVVMGVYHPTLDETRWIIINSVPRFRPGERTPYQVYSTFDDITERKRAGEALRESEKKYRNLVETSHDLIWSVDAEGRFTFVNRSAARSILGYEPEEMIGKQLTTFKTTEQAEKDMKVFAEIMAGKKYFGYETVYRRKDGSFVPMNFNAMVVKDNDGKIIGTTGTAQDITDRKRMEHELVHTQKMKTVGHLTGGVAHEFNNLLQVVLGNLQMLRDYPCDQDEMDEMLDNAIAASKRGGNLTQQLLSFSRKQALSPKVVNINDVVLGIIQLLHRTLGEDITLKTKLAKDLVSVNIDPGSFENAILNLALNARSAMPKGGVLTIETANVGLEEAIPHEDGDLPVGKYVAVTVSDTGCGMSPEVLERAIEPFFTTRDVGQGTGLGLSMAYGFSRQSGGHTTIDSEPGKGTTVRLYLPVSEIPAIEEPGLPENGKAEATGSGTVLVVEDDLQVRQTTGKILNLFGYVVIEAEDGPSALEILQQRDDIDLVFSDVIMPEGMTGIVLAEIIHRSHKGVRVLLMSGYPASEFDEDGTLEDRFDFLRKPYSTDQLATAVKAAIER